MEPYYNLCLAVLGSAKKVQTKMWEDFIREYDITKRNHSPFRIALWMVEWWRRDLTGQIKYGPKEPKDEE